MISQSDLTSRSFRMTRGDGAVVAAAVYPLSDGRLFGTSHPNEAFWTIAGDNVEFLDRQRNVTTRFTEIARGEAGWRLAGQFVHGGAALGTHILEESCCPVDARDVGRTPAGTSAVVMIRTHVIDDRVQELLEHLDRGRRNFDLFLAVDETNGRPETDLQNVVWHSVARCPELGLTHTRERLIWWCGDFPFYFALAQLPQYQYYIMIENDVHLTQCDASLLIDLAAALLSGATVGIDAVGTRLLREVPIDHELHRLLHRPAFAFFETTYSYFFPLIALSRQAVSYLYAQRQLEAMRETPADAVLHCESFVPSHLIRAGFSCVDLNAVLPGSYLNDLMVLPAPQYGIPRCQANGFEGFARMIHPVYGDGDFLQRLLSRCHDAGHQQYLLRRIDDGEFDPIPAPLLARFRSQVVAAVPGPEPELHNRVA